MVNTGTLSEVLYYNLSLFAVKVQLLGQFMESNFYRLEPIFSINWQLIEGIEIFISVRSLCFDWSQILNNNKPQGSTSLLTWLLFSISEAARSNSKLKLKRAQFVTLIPAQLQSATCRGHRLSNALTPDSIPLPAERL